MWLLVVGVAACSGAGTGSSPPPVGATGGRAAGGGPAATGGARSGGSAAVTGGQGTSTGGQSSSTGGHVPPDAAEPDASSDDATIGDALESEDAFTLADASRGDGGLAGASTGARENIDWLVTTVWSGTRRTVALDGAAKVFTAGFEAGKFGGMGNGHIIRLPIAPGSEYVFEYRLRFDEGYDFSRGGKIPGLGGGNAPSGCETSTGVGFTARQMWRENGRLIGYIYDMDQRGECGNNLETGFSFVVGRWYTIKQRIKLNTGTQHNGVLQLWVDDRQVINRSNMGWMGEAPNRRIDRIFLDFFFGGSTADWSPRRNCSLSFTDVHLTRVAE